jgi:hypothetical protein
VNGLKLKKYFVWEKCELCMILYKGDLKMDLYHSCIENFEKRKEKNVSYEEYS